MAGLDEIGNLITPVAAIAEPAMQQDDGWTSAITRIPDARAFVFDEALFVRLRKRWDAVAFKIGQIIVAKGHRHLPFCPCVNAVR
ncbi:hypothetical protein D3C87_2047300 [compost metagenome]